MPAHKGVEAWIEDSEHRKLNHQGVTIDLIDADDRTVTVKTQMSRDELYTVHCISPISVFCEVFLVTASRARKCAARFYLDKSLAVTGNASGSSTDHTVDRFRDHGLRTPKRQLQGKLITVEVEIRRIGEIIKGEPGETGEDGGVDFIMVDQPHQQPWLIFRFEISAKESLAVPASTARRVRGRPPRRVLISQSQIISAGSNNDKIGHESHDGSSNVGGHTSLADTNLHLLQRELQEEEAEEQRLMQKMHERLRTKKARNMELRRLLGET